MSRCLPVVVAASLVLAASASAEPPHREGLWGGSTVQHGVVPYLRGSGGYEMNGLAAGELGVLAALTSRLDVGLSLRGNVGIGSAMGLGARVRFNVKRFRGFAMAVEVAGSSDAYLDSKPRLLISGVEPALMVSVWPLSHLEVFAGAKFRYYRADGVNFVGPGARAGLSVPLSRFSIFLAANASPLATTSSPVLRTWSGELGFSVKVGQP